VFLNRSKKKKQMIEDKEQMDLEEGNRLRKVDLMWGTDGYRDKRDVY
jgi:hypothetical protein